MKQDDKEAFELFSFCIGILFIFFTVAAIHSWHEAVEQGRQRNARDEERRLADSYRNRLVQTKVCSNYCDSQGHLVVREWSRGYDCTCMTKLVNEQ